MAAGAQPAWWARRPWLAAALLYLPMAAIYAAHALSSYGGLVPTGFLQYDQLSYMAMAREYFDPVPDGNAWLTYGLPFSADYATPEVYFQPHTLLLGLLLELSGAQPGWVYFLFGVVAGLIFLRLAVALYCRCLDQRRDSSGLGLLLFAWGGGLFAVAGLATMVAENQWSPQVLFTHSERYDTWFLNLGRNLYYSVEAYYHCLTLGLLVALIDRRFGLALLLLAVLSASHPFTGLQFLLAIATWSLAERLLLRQPSPLPWWLPLGCAALLALHLGYYMVLLPRLSAEHAWIAENWSRDWSFEPTGLLLAYGLVGALAAVSLVRDALGQPRRRLLLVLALVSLALANHDLLLTPRQPLHFTRGYIWIPLFLLGLPALLRLLGWLSRVNMRWVLGLALVLLLDNATWIAWQTRNNLVQASLSTLLQSSEVRLLERLSRPDLAGALLVTAEPQLGYLATVFTPLRSWSS
ncbi:MAG TPA: hypothetical protein VJL84_11065, partial [Kiloniellales bacterium]|nr:hypothetical protein [Kiloniellales bacterium]